jgi:hypothetical protein
MGCSKAKAEAVVNVTSRTVAAAGCPSSSGRSYFVFLLRHGHWLA